MNMHVHVQPVAHSASAYIALSLREDVAVFSYAVGKHSRTAPRGETYFAMEGSKGELGVYLISDGSEYPWRAKLRGPSFVNLLILPELLRGHTISDEIAIMGSMDFVLGEVDR